MKRIAVVQTSMLKPPLVNMAATLESESKHYNRHHHEEISGKLSSETENSP